MNWLFKTLISATVSTLSLLTPTPNSDNPILQGPFSRDKHGSNYWNTSNIREWLNSNESSGNVRFTSKAPNATNTGLNQIYDYDKQAGFLKSFTNEELSNIAFTERKNLLGYDDRGIATNGKGAGGNHKGNNTSSLKFNNAGAIGGFDNVAANISIDRVFLLDFREIYRYYETRGWNLTKSVSDAVSNKYNLQKNTLYDWWSLFPIHNIGHEYQNVITSNINDINRVSHPNAISGVAPALHVKPNTSIKKVKDYQSGASVNSMVIAKNLNIGDIVQFGTYMGENIKWTVVNFTGDYPLLHSERVLDLKVFDSKGDRSYKNSHLDSVKNYDVSTYNHSFVNTFKSSDCDYPSISILNEDDLLNKRQNGSYNLSIRFSDTSNVKEIILPDKSKLAINKAEHTLNYTVNENGFFPFTTSDGQGNYRQFILPVGNINLEPTVQVTQSTSNWTNNDVNYSVSASNNVGWENKNGYVQDVRDIGGGTWGNYTTYAGKKIRVKGTVEYVGERNGVDINKYGYGMAFSYKKIIKTGDEYSVTWHYPSAHNASINSLKQRKLNGEGPLHIDTEFVVGNDFFSNFSTRTHIGVGSEDSGNIILQWSNISYELLDNTDFGITKIELPNGQSVNQPSYSGTISEEGEKNHKFIVHDNSGLKTTRTITTRIDKTKPVLSADITNKSPTNVSVPVNIAVSDSLSGIHSIEGPNYTSNPGGGKNININYSAPDNKTYTFTVKDIAGNTSTLSFTINNIDRVAPVTTISGSSTHWRKGPVTLSLGATDSMNRITKIEYKMNGADSVGWSTYTNPISINSNGSTEITARSYDLAGNISPEVSGFIKIDNVAPTAKFSVDNTTSSLNIKIKVSELLDSHSGLNFVNISNKSDYSSPTKVSFASNANIEIPFSLDKKNTTDEHYTERTIYIQLYDNANNLTTYTVKTTLTLDGQIQITIEEPFNDTLYQKTESIPIKWNLSSKNSDFNNIKQTRAVVKLKNESTNEKRNLNVTGNTFSTSYINLTPGTYKVQVESFISDKVSLHSEQKTIRVGVYKNRGNVITKNIQLSSPIEYIKIFTSATIPKNTSAKGFICYTDTSTSTPVAKREPFVINNSEEAKILSLKAPINSFKIEYQLSSHDSGTLSYESPILDSIRVFGR